MKESLDQKRARFAWENVKGQGEEYAKLAKGAPALIMQSGLMPVLAFLRGRGGTHDKLCEHLCEWLHKNEQFKGRTRSPGFDDVMEALVGKEGGDPAEHARFYQEATEEVMALLRWIRQFATVLAEAEGARDA